MSALRYTYCSSDANIDYLVGEQMIAKNPNITFGELANALVSADSFDTAIPQDFWRDRLDATGINISGHVVTTYGPNDFFPLTLDGALALYGPEQVRHDLEETILLRRLGLAVNQDSADMAHELLKRLLETAS